MPSTNPSPSDAEKTKEELFQDNIGLAYYTLGKTFPDYIANEDARQIALIGLWAACQKYDPERGKFVTFAPWCVRSELLVHREEFLPDYSLSLCGDMADDENRDISFEGSGRDCSIDDSDFYTDFKKFLEDLSPRQRSSVVERANGGTYAEVGKSHGVSTERARQIICQVKDQYEKFVKEKPDHEKF